MNNKLDYRYLKAFFYTATYLNFSRAAEKLSIAQSAVSRQIKLLEEALGQQLVIRSSKKVVLTNAGNMMFRSIQNFEQMVDKITENSGPQIIRVGILHGLLENWFIKIIQEFTKKAPHELHIEIDTPDNLKMALIEGKIDIIFTTENIQSELISSLKLFEENLVIVSKEKFDIDDIASYTWITYSQHDYLFELYKKHSSKTIRVASMTAILKLVERNVGIAIVPSHTLSEKTQFNTYHVKTSDNPVIHMATHNFQKMPSHLQDFAEVVKNNI